jgi:hypothetical protein
MTKPKSFELLMMVVVVMLLDNKNKREKREGEGKRKKRKKGAYDKNMAFFLCCWIVFPLLPTPYLVR